MSADSPLRDYLEKRDFDRTPEPRGGTVLVWDAGPYTVLKTEADGEPVPVEDQLADGKLTVWLHGEKIRGGYALVRTGGSDDQRWLLIKMDDEEADARRNPTSTEPRSVLSGRTLDEIEAEEGGEEDGSAAGEEDEA